MRGSLLLGSSLGVAMLFASLACGVAATPPAPTVSAVAPPFATAVQAVGTPAAAVASPVATTVAAAASQAVGAAPSIATPAAGVVSPLATAVSASSVALTGWQIGSDDASLTLRNTSSTTLDLSGWRLRVGAQSAALPPGTRLDPGDSLTLHISRGTSTGNDVYLGDEGVALLPELRPGAPVMLVDRQGDTLVRGAVPGR